MRNSRISILSVLATLAIIATPRAASSTPVTWVYEGNVHASSYFPTIADGTVLRMSWTFDSAQQDLCNSPGQGTFLGQTALVELGTYQYHVAGVLDTNAHFFSGCGAGLYTGENELRFPQWSGPGLPNADGTTSPLWFSFGVAPPGFFFGGNYLGDFPSTPPPGGYFDGPLFFGPNAFSPAGWTLTPMHFVQVGPVPEPGTIALLGTGSALLLRRRHRQRKFTRN